MEFKNYEDFKVSSKGIRLEDYPKKSNQPWEKRRLKES